MNHFLKGVRYRTKRRLKKIINTKLNIGNKRQCYVCKTKFDHFGKRLGGFANVSDFLMHLQTVGSDVDNFYCYFCGCMDRTRHLFMFFDKLKLWERFTNARVLHFAPEADISKKIMGLNPREYIMADLYPKNEEVQKIDLTDIPFQDESFDILICNHVLEHVPDYKKAMREINRVLVKGGFAILQTPYSLLLHKNFEDENINTDELKLFFYGQEDHVRVFSQGQFFNDLEEAGFQLKIGKNEDLFSEAESKYYGVNKIEDLIQVIK